MNYLSTRGAGAGERHTFSEILLGGLAKDGGLYLPAEYPRVTADELTRWRTLPYADLAFEILSKFSDDIPAEDLRALTRKTYTAETYCNVRDDESAAQITPLKTLGVENGAPLSLLELSNGPTLAFKDMAMQLIGNLFEYALARHGETLNILGATSGDTGSAAEYAMRGKQGISVFMLSPHKKMSAFQTAQMYSLQDPNIFNIAVEGVFDDCPGHRKGGVERPRVQGEVQDRHGQLDQLGACGGAGSVLLQGLLCRDEVERRARVVHGAVGQFRQRVCGPHRAHDGFAD